MLDQLPGNVWAEDIFQDSRGFVWFSCRTGLLRYDGYTPQVFVTEVDNPHSLQATEVHTVFESADGLIWIGSASSGINTFDPVTGQFSHWKIPGTTQLRIWHFHENDAHTIWLATEGHGLVLLDRKDSTVQYHRPDISDDDYHQTIRFIHPNSLDSSSLWLGTRNGLLSFNLRDSSFQHHVMPFQAYDHKDFMIMDCLEDVDNVLWLSSYWGGLISYDPVHEVWAQYSFGDQFKSNFDRSDNIVADLLSLDHNTLLLPTSGGLLAFDLVTKEFTRVSPAPLDEASNYYMSVYRTFDGTVIVSGYGNNVGLSTPNALDTAIAIVPPSIRDIKIDGLTYRTDRTFETVDELVLDEYQHDLTLEISSPQFKLPNILKYSYQLVGHDKDWVYSDTRRHISYTNLKGGNYQFKYRVSANGTDWLAAQSDLLITKKVPFWRHPLFLIAVVLFIISMIMLVAHLRVRSIRKEAVLTTQFNRRLMEVELSALRAQMNPHFMFNSLNSIKYYILKNQNDQANKYLTKFSQLMRSVLKDSKSKLISLADELHALRLYIELEALRFTEKGFDFFIEIGDGVDPQTMYLPPLLVQPYVENAIWHGLLHKEGPGTLWVRVNKNGKALFIEIEDDGIGRESAKQRKSKSATKNKSFGMQITSNRIALVKETFGIESKVEVVDLQDADGNASGTKVILEIPLISEEHYEQILESSNP